MSLIGTLLPSAEAALCPQLAQGDIRALAEKPGLTHSGGPAAHFAVMQNDFPSMWYVEMGLKRH